MGKTSLLFGLVFVLCINQILSYKILVVVTLPSKSHYNLGKGLADILHERGHEVTMITSMKNDKPKYRELFIEELIQIKSNSSVPMGFDLTSKNPVSTLLWIADVFPKTVDIIFENAEIKKFINDKNEKFNLVIFESFLNDALIALGVRFDCPVIALSPHSLMSWLALKTGNPLAPETTPNIFLHTTNKMNLIERATNVLNLAVQELLGYFILEPTHEAIYKKHFPKESAVVPYSELKNKISLVFLNSHPSINAARPLLPNAVEIAGYHIGETKPLPEDIQKIMDSAKNGVIYFSMGSNLRSADMSIEVQNTLLKAFSKLKQTVLWKFEKDLPNKPSNVIIRNWMPQPGILAHKNTKFFISHGGFLSVTEATNHGVPLLAVPIFGDQHHNALALQEKGSGLIVAYSNLTETSLNWALNEMLNNPSYTTRAKEIQRIYNDRPMRPKDLINFCCEHVIRTKGGIHLSPPRLPRISSLLLDVFMLILVPIHLLIIGLLFTCKKICGRKTKTPPPQQQGKKSKKNN